MHAVKSYRVDAAFNNCLHSSLVVSALLSYTASGRNIPRLQRPVIGSATDSDTGQPRDWCWSTVIVVIPTDRVDALMRSPVILLFQCEFEHNAYRQSRWACVEKLRFHCWWYVVAREINCCAQREHAVWPLVLFTKLALMMKCCFLF